MENIKQSSSKNRHGCVTAWLIFMIIANSLSAILYLFAGNMVAHNFPGEISNSTIIILALLSIGNVVFSIMLLKWMKIGFWGFLATSIGALIINLSIGLGIVQSLFGLLGLGVLYGILQIKKDNESAWNNLD